MNPAKGKVNSPPTAQVVAQPAKVTETPPPSPGEPPPPGPPPLGGAACRVGPLPGAALDGLGATLAELENLYAQRAPLQSELAGLGLEREQLLQGLIRRKPAGGDGEGGAERLTRGEGAGTGTLKPPLADSDIRSKRARAPLIN